MPTEMHFHFVDRYILIPCQMYERLEILNVINVKRPDPSISAIKITEYFSNLLKLDYYHF